MANFLGMQYPLVETSRGILAQKSGVDQIKADLLQLLLTNPGERVMIPTFGVALRTLFFEQNDAVLERTATAMIQQAIQTWERRIAIANIVVTSQFSANQLNPSDTGSESSHILGIIISFYNPQDISQINELAVEVPVS